MKITSDLTNLTTAILILTVQMFFEWTLLLSRKHFDLTGEFPGKSQKTKRISFFKMAATQ
jgi:hypothetical protein